jgi:hypothetical protein
MVQSIRINNLVDTIAASGGKRIIIFRKNNENLWEK